MEKRDIDFIFGFLKDNFYSVDTELAYSTPFELVVAVILSAQCTDKRVNMITPNLRKRFPDANTMAQWSKDEIFELIKRCSYPNNKAKSLLWMAQMLVSDFDLVIPDNLDDLQKLPWVWLKTAKVVAHVLYDEPVIAVDTHVFRVINRLWILHEKNRDKMSILLEKAIPYKYKKIAHHSLIYFGRYWCTARNPKCSNCGLARYCEWNNVDIK